MPRIILHGTLSQGLLTLFWTALFCAVAVFLLRRLFHVGEEGYRKLLHFAILAVLSVWLFAFRDWQLCALTMLAFVALAYPILYGLGKIPGLQRTFRSARRASFGKVSAWLEACSWF